MDVGKLKAHLVRDEALKLKPYRCSAGKLSIGVGRNLDDVGISEAEAMFLLGTDIAGVLADLDRNLPGWRNLPEAVRLAIANMCFNMGWPRLALFKGMWAALDAGDWDKAADEALDSLWARQVGARAVRIADLIRSAGRV